MSSEQSNEHAVQLPGAYFNLAAAARSERTLAVRRMGAFRRQLFDAMDHFRTLACNKHADRKRVETCILGIETAAFAALFIPGSPTLMPPWEQAGFLEAMAVNRAFFARDPKGREVRQTILAVLFDNPASGEVLDLLALKTAEYVQRQLKMIQAIREHTWVEQPAS